MSSHEHTAEFTKGICVFYSSVGGNKLWTGHFDRVCFLLSAKQIPFHVVDIAADAAALSFMREQTAMSNKIAVPQVFQEGKYLGGKEEVDNSNEWGEIYEFFGIAAPQKIVR